MKYFKNYDKFLFESKNVLNNLEVKILEDFIDYLHFIFNKKINTYSDYIELKNFAIKYNKFEYFKPMGKTIEYLDGIINNYKKTELRYNYKKYNFNSDINRVIEYLKNGNIKNALDINSKWINFTTENKSIGKTLNLTLSQYYINPYIIIYHPVISANDLSILKRFDKNQFDELYKIRGDIKNMFSKYGFPKKYTFENLTTFALSLGSKESKKYSDLKTEIELEFSDNKYFLQIKKLIGDYLKSNVKGLIPIILNLMNKVPRLKELNDKSKEGKYVYRGIALNYEYDKNDNKLPIKTPDDILKKDVLEKFVASSSAYNVAENFAKARPHYNISDDDTRSSDYGYIIKYEILNKDSIVINCAIMFGSMYKEAEILIDASKCKVNSITSI